jgi:large subunit ribosomal protein L15
MKLHDLSAPPGARTRRRRVGRGIAGKGGKTAGRGTKGYKARHTTKAGFEGGQTRLTRRVPKLKGFKNPFRVEYHPVSLAALAGLELPAGETVTPDTLLERGVGRKHKLVKILGDGELSTPLSVYAHAFSGSAERAIRAAGGSVSVVPPPFGRGRPSVRGNALANR